MEARWTTRCCSAFALALLSRLVTAAPAPADTTLGLFPAPLAWTLPLNNPLQAAPALSGTRGYFPIEGDRLAAYDIEKGTLLWIVNAQVRSQPAVGGGMVFVIEPDALIAFGEDTGTVAWRLPFQEKLSAPLVWSNGWVVGASSGAIYAFRGADGALMWRQEIGTGVHAAPVLARDRVYVPAANGVIIALGIDTGERVWERRIGGEPNDILALDDRLFVGSTDNFLYSIGARDGRILWRWMTGGDVIGRPVADQRRVYFVSLDNVLRGLDRRTGAQRWKRALPVRPTRGPVLAGDVLIVSGLAPTLPAYSVKDGAPAGELPAGAEVAAAPHVVPTEGLPMLIFVTRDLAKGTVVSAVRRSVEPARAVIAPLPNPIVPVAPQSLPSGPLDVPIEPLPNPEFPPPLPTLSQ